MPRTDLSALLGLLNDLLGELDRALGPAEAGAYLEAVKGSGKAATLARAELARR